jgi:2-methylcitrate dehydratase
MTETTKSSKSEEVSERATDRLARWIRQFAAMPLTDAAQMRAKGVLLDSIGCAIAAHCDHTTRMIVEQTRAVGGRRDATVIGAKIQAPFVACSFANEVLIRALDLNDSYSGPGLVGHPSDNIGPALAACQFAERPLVDLLRAIRLGYEVYGRILDLMNPKTTAWDHTVASGLTTAAMTGWLFGYSDEQMSEALALVASHSAVSRVVRGAHISSAKSIASAIVGQTSCLLTLLAGQGATGPGEALEGPRGFGRVILGADDFDGFFALESERDRLFANSFKLYPCFALGQAPIDAAVESSKQIGRRLGDLERIDLSLADTAPAHLRLKDSERELPRTREAADHSLQFVVAAALVDGSFGLAQFESERWNDPLVRDVMTRVHPRIDASLPQDPPGAFPCRLESRFKDGSRIIVERMSTRGHATRPLTWDEVKEKFRNSSAAFLTLDEQERVADYIHDIDASSTAAKLLELCASNKLNRD